MARITWDEISVELLCKLHDVNRSRAPAQDGARWDAIHEGNLLNRHENKD